jgi:hypothetical protein
VDWRSELRPGNRRRNNWKRRCRKRSKVDRSREGNGEKADKKGGVGQICMGCDWGCGASKGGEWRGIGGFGGRGG